MRSIVSPTLLLNESICRDNIRLMTEKAMPQNILFRPHFKTHQSATIGNWFQEAGVTSITVSSVRMARYFAQSGWNKITIAFPLNIRELQDIEDLSKTIELSILISDPEAIPYLQGFPLPLNVWIEIDTGYHRSGLAFDQEGKIEKTIMAIGNIQNLRLIGFLSHTGNTYHTIEPDEIKSCYQEAVLRLVKLKNRFERPGQSLAISMGDTPSASILDNFGPIQEMRPGNFVFYDLMQYYHGVCALSDIAVALACPVVAKYPDRGEIVVYGGAIHLSKEYIEQDGRKIFGHPVLLKEKKWLTVGLQNVVVSLSQEHGIIRLENAMINAVNVGDLLGILPVHACLTANLMKGYRTLDGRFIDHLEGAGTF